MITIEPYSKEWEQKHILFASKYWSKRRRKEPEYIYWKFRGDGKNKLTSFLLAIEEGKVIGQLGLIPCTLKVDNNLYDAQWACDLMVDKDLRGKNVAAQLYAFAHQLKSITLGSDPSPAASKSMKKSGYLALKGSWKHLFPLTVGEVTKLKGYDFKFLNFLYNPFVLLFFLMAKFRRDAFEKVEINDYEKLNHLKKSGNTIFINRDPNFINWRFNCFKSYYPEMEIYSHPNKSVFFSGYFSGTSYYITDLNVQTIADVFQIISSILQRFKKQGLRRVRFCMNQEKISKKLLFFGFIKFRTQTEIIYYSTDPAINKEMEGKKFYYTFMDSDENI